ncbi:MAG: alpha/beta hydrolase [Caldilineaceae bacterium]|nr:alpha/beta hydrolase [Caldilineaceae bacterium]
MTPLTNTMHVPTADGRTGSKRIRRIALGLGVVLVLFAGLALAGASYEAIAARGDAQAYPAPGQLVDVGGYSLHIQCVGTGAPTVVLDAGLGGTSLDWNLVQTQIGQTTRVCAYDRAGMGWSENSPALRTPARIASELHTLLGNAGIAGPYILVGHSLAGKNARMFALQHPDKVAGMVLVDTRSEYVDQHSSPTEVQAFQQEVATQGNLYGLARTLGLVRLFGASLEGAPAMTDETRLEMALFASGQRGLDATSAEALQRATDDGQLQAAPPLGALPLIVLAAGQSMEQIPYWPEAQRRLSALSTKGRLIVVEDSGHAIHAEQPALVIDAVQQVIDEARGH